MLLDTVREEGRTAGPLADRIRSPRPTDPGALMLRRLAEEIGRADPGTVAEMHFRAIEKATNVLRMARLRGERATRPIVAADMPEGERRLGKAAYKSHRLALLAADPTCAYCGNPVTRASATLDHLVPECRGGLSVPENLVLACPACNQSKSDRTPQEWADAILAAVKGGAN